MIHSKAEAYRMLGLSTNASKADVKSAYHRLVKQYHPDAGETADGRMFELITEAYEVAIGIKKVDSGRLVAEHKSQFRSTASAKDYASFEKKMAKQRSQKLKDLEAKAAAEAEKRRIADEEYKKAMEAIDAIRIADAIKAMVWANGVEKDS